MILVDDEDKDLLENYSWSANGDGYIAGWYDGKVRYLHRVIMERHHGIPAGMDVDHRDNDGPKSDCRKANLRIVTRSVNGHNRGEANVSSRYGRYQAKVTIDYKQHYLGTFDTAQEAYEAAQQFKTEKGLT